MAVARRITSMMSTVVEQAALDHLGPDDDFDYEVGISAEGPDEDGDLTVGVWAIFRLDCPESGSRSVMGISSPLRFMNEESFRMVVERTMSEMQFSRIAAAEAPE